MTKRLGVQVLLLASVVMSGTVASAEAPFCVQTFNAFGPIYSRGIAERLHDMIRAFKKEGACEVSQFQEVWSEEQYEILKQGFKEELDRDTAIRFEAELPTPKRLGLASFLLWGAQRIGVHAFQMDKDSLYDDIRKLVKVGKGFGFAEVNLREGRASEMISLSNLHLHPFSQSVRIAQLTEWLQWLDSRLPLDHPLILTGDFNFEPTSVEYQLVTDVLALQDSVVRVKGRYSKEDCTYCSDNPLSPPGTENRVIDYVFYHPTGALRLMPRSAEVNMKQYEGRPLSDHYGVRVQFDQQVHRYKNVSAWVGSGVRDPFESALQALRNASEYLKADNSRKYRDYLIILNSFTKRFEKREVNDLFIQYWSHAKQDAEIQ